MVHPPRRLLALTLALTASLSAVPAALAPTGSKFLGSAMGSSVPASFSTYWNQATPENGGKWGSVEAARDVMD